MGLLRKKKTSTKADVEETKTTGVDESATQAPTDNKEERKTKVIRKGVKVTVTGRLYGTPTKEAPMGFATGLVRIFLKDFPLLQAYL